MNDNNELLINSRDQNERVLSSNPMPHDSYLRTSNLNNDKFLFVFTPESLAVDCCCGCSLRTGVQIIAILFLTGALSNFFTALRIESTLDLIISGLAFLLYFSAGICILYSTMKSDFVYGYTGYVIIAVCFIISLADNILVIILTFFGIYRPLPHENPPALAFIMLLSLIIIMSVHLYMLWVIFSYAIHLKHKRLALIDGHILYKYYDYPVQGQSSASPVEVRQDV